MQNIVEAETRVRQLVRKLAHEPLPDARQRAEIIAGDVAAQVYHYLTAVAHAELAIRQAQYR